MDKTAAHTAAAAASTETLMAWLRNLDSDNLRLHNREERRQAYGQELRNRRAYLRDEARSGEYDRASRHQLRALALRITLTLNDTGDPAMLNDSPRTPEAMRRELKRQGWDDLALSAMDPADMRAELDR